MQQEATDPMPSSLPGLERDDARPPAASLLTSVTDITNLGTLNNGLPGDVIVGFFKPLHEIVRRPELFRPGILHGRQWSERSQRDRRSDPPADSPEF